jgi:hypothetical protein
VVKAVPARDLTVPALIPRAFFGALRPETGSSIP